jgi:hypothetical protein
MNEGPETDNQSIETESSVRTHGISDEGNEYAQAPEYDSNALAAIHALREDFGRRLELVSNRQNTMFQSIGILLAFASILMTQAISMIFLNPDNVCGTVALATFLLCCAAGIVTIWEWRNWKLFTGLNSDELADLFNRRRFIHLQKQLLSGVIESNDRVAYNNLIIKNRIYYMVVSLSAGVALMLIGMVMI